MGRNIPLRLFTSLYLKQCAPNIFTSIRLRRIISMCILFYHSPICTERSQNSDFYASFEHTSPHVFQWHFMVYKPVVGAVDLYDLYCTQFVARHFLPSSRKRGKNCKPWYKYLYLVQVRVPLGLAKKTTTATVNAWYCSVESKRLLPA